MNELSYTFDAFISHTVEDKIPIANELCDRLERTGARIWYCGRELNAGDSIKRTIQEGLSKSRYGIIILSKSFLSKSWNPAEFLNFIIGEYYTSKKNILLLLYNITKEDLPCEIQENTERFAYQIGKELDDVIQYLIGEINSSLSATPNKRRQKFSLLKAVSKKLRQHCHPTWLQIKRTLEKKFRL